MVICNVVIDLNEDYTEADVIRLSKYKKCDAINVVTDIEDIIENIPTLVYGYKFSRVFYEVDRNNKFIENNVCWSFNDSELKSNNWIDDFVSSCISTFFKYEEIGIDMVFQPFDLDEFVSKLHPYPLIHEGNYEIYIAENVDNTITIYSIKKDTLEYLNIKPNDFLNDLYTKLNYEFMSLSPEKFSLADVQKPIFLNLILFVEKDVITTFNDIISNFSIAKLDRKMIMVYYLKALSELHNDTFLLYR